MTALMSWPVQLLSWRRILMASWLLLSVYKLNQIWWHELFRYSTWWRILLWGLLNGRNRAFGYELLYGWAIVLCPWCECLFCWCFCAHSYTLTKHKLVALESNKDCTGMFNAHLPVSCGCEYHLWHSDILNTNEMIFILELGNERDRQ